ncbi:site-specific integrase [Pantoea sp. S61]|uniref:site-specific integrase n=1 Tax=Pantoea sp. S61 TaxID=2767442 RepID=UPI00190CD661|nr:site-specific integrase [Pantoea sp. S61]MBK0127071.1 site-specific integrase [Pantoea sp. S61]
MLKVYVNSEDNESAYEAKTKGYYFSLNDEAWRLSRNVTVNVKMVKDVIDKELMEGYLKVLKYLACELSPATVKLINNNFRRFIVIVDPKRVDEFSLVRFRGSDGKNNNIMSSVRILIKKWYELGYSGIDEDAYDFLCKLIIPDNKKGEVVRRRDQVKGPFTDIELQSFLEACYRAYDKGNIDITQLAMALLISATGRRPLQISQMKVSDIRRLKVNENSYSYVISIPRIKQGLGFREAYRNFQVTKELYDLLRKQCDLSLEQTRSILKRELTNNEIENTPLFISMQKLESFKINKELKEIFVSDKVHEYSVKINNTLGFIAETENVISERTYERLNVNPRRFRYTVGTRAAREGASELVIAELLDHSTTKYTGVYVEFNADHVARIDEAVGNHMKKYAGFFQGKIEGDDSIKKNELAVRDLSGEVTGACGGCKSCQANVPVPCYTCHHFRPFIDAPHIELRDHLLKQRERIMTDTKDETMSKTLDRTIMAVEEVVKKCETLKLKRSNRYE